MTKIGAGHLLYSWEATFPHASLARTRVRINHRPTWGHRHGELVWKSLVTTHTTGKSGLDLCWSLLEPFLRTDPADVEDAVLAGRDEAWQALFGVGGLRLDLAVGEAKFHLEDWRMDGLWVSEHAVRSHGDTYEVRMTWHFKNCTHKEALGEHK